MSPELVMYLIVGAGALGAAVTLAVAVVRGRQAPAHRVPWILALILAGLAALFITVVAIASLGHGSAWIALGAVGLWCLFVLALMRPRWSAWVFLVSAVLLPVLLWLGQFVVSRSEEMLLEPINGLGAYSVRAFVTAALLLWAAWPRRSSEA